VRCEAEVIGYSVRREAEVIGYSVRRSRLEFTSEVPAGPRPGVTGPVGSSSAKQIRIDDLTHT